MTPRTDAQSFPLHGSYCRADGTMIDPLDAVATNFARTLERENNELLEVLRELVSADLSAERQDDASLSLSAIAKRARAILARVEA